MFFQISNSIYIFKNNNIVEHLKIIWDVIRKFNSNFYRKNIFLLLNWFNKFFLKQINRKY